MVKSAAENNQVDEYELTMEILYAISVQELQQL